MDYVAGKKNNDDFVKQVDDEVKKIRENKAWRRDYMTLLMRDREKFEEGLKQGEIKMVLRLISVGELTIKKGAKYLGITETEMERYLSEQQ